MFVSFEIKNVNHRNVYIQEQFPCCYLLPYVQRSFSDVAIFVETLCFQVSSIKNNFGKGYKKIWNLFLKELQE